MKENEDGTFEFVYEDPLLFYIWLDYNDIQLYAMKEFILEERENSIVSKITGLIFTQKTSNGKPQTISYMPIVGPFESQFFSYPSEKLNELPWYTILRKETERKKKNAN